jgi:3-methyladenine DNA glycosylase AlkD
MTCNQAMAKLKALGSAQTRKIYGNHGVKGEMFGVKYGDMNKLAKQIKVDHELAKQLWATGNHDARILATKIVDHAKVDAKLLTEWIKGVEDHVISYAVADLAARADKGRKTFEKWMASKSEWRAATGWMALAGIASRPDAVTRDQCRKLLAEIEERIHESANRAKYSMNTAMIALGAYVPGMEKEAIQVADRIGQVEVDHGLTACETPLAAPYIKKAAAHHRAKLAKATKKKPTKRKAARPRAGC